jgi:hypothetical protein
VSVLQFFVRPTIYCRVCGSVTVSSEIDKDARTIECFEQTCSQFKRKARIIDQHLLMFEQPSDLVLDPHGNH